MYDIHVDELLRKYIFVLHEFPSPNFRVSYKVRYSLYAQFITLDHFIVSYIYASASIRTLLYYGPYWWLFIV